MARCPHCRLTLNKLDLRFGVAPRHFGLLADVAGQLPPGKQRKVQELLELFAKKFPQSIFSVYLTDLPAGTLPNEYAFWLANRARSNTAASVGPRNFDLVLVLDRGGGAALAAGYGLENYLKEEDLGAALAAGREDFVAGAWAAGIGRCVDALTERMRVAALRKPETAS